jgi:hypothetical protein
MKDADRNFRGVTTMWKTEKKKKKKSKENIVVHRKVALIPC